MGDKSLKTSGSSIHDGQNIQEEGIFHRACFEMKLEQKFRLKDFSLAHSVLSSFLISFTPLTP